MGMGGEGVCGREGGGLAPPPLPLVFNYSKACKFLHLSGQWPAFFIPGLGGDRQMGLLWCKDLVVK